MNQQNNSQKSQRDFQLETSKKKAILLALIIVLIIATSIIIGLIGCEYFTPQIENPKLPAAIKNEPNKTPTETITAKDPNLLVFYESDDQIWQFDPKTETKKKIGNGMCPKVSPDKTKVVYTYQNWNKYLKPSEDNLTGIHIFDITTNKNRLLKHDEDSWCGAWSPDGKYLLIDAGTSPTRFITVIDSTTGETVISFNTSCNFYAWVSDDEIVFNDLQHITEPRPYGEGEGSGLAIINLSNQKRILKTATTKEDYSFIQLLDDGKIYFSLTTVESKEGWFGGDQSFSYWTMDKFGDNLTQIEKLNTEL